MKVWCLTIRIKRIDELHGKRLQNLLIDFLMSAKISCATLWNGVDGFGKRIRSTINQNLNHYFHR
jgi:uncharacterized protein